MNRHYFRFERTFWFLIRALLYVGLLYIFVYILGKENRGLANLSRTLGIVISTYAILEYVFVKAYGGYDVGRRKSKPIIFSLGFATAFTDIIVYLQVMIMRTNGSSVSDFRFYSPELLLLVILVQIIYIIVFAYAGNEIFFKIHEPERSIIITSTQAKLNEMVRCITNLKKQYKIVGAYHYESSNIDELIKDAETVFMCNIPSEERAKLMKIAYRYQKNVYLTPEIEDIMEMSSSAYLIDDTVMVNYLGKSLTLEQRIAKRMLDLVLSVLIGVLTAPIVLIAAIAIKIEDGGPVFYFQKRATINGREFNVFKLRTMSANDNAFSATKNDKRITKVGKFLRRTRIDEIPQIYNILRGEMSFVGPRPEMLKNVEKYTEELPEFAYRLRVKGGLTGYAQIKGKYNTTPKDKLVMDMMYIEQYSLLLDLQLIFQTVLAVIRPDSSEGFMEELTGNCLDLTLNRDYVGVDKDA